MKSLVATTSAAFLALALATPALADPYKDERGHHRHHRHGAWKEEYRDGNCKIERKWSRNEYKEEIKCKGGGPPRIVAVSPGYPVQPSAVIVQRRDNVFGCNRELLGSVIGGAAGGVLGAQVGKGTGRIAATAGGTLIGVLVGGHIGRTMDSADHACVGHVLEQVQPNTIVTWQNPGGTAYEIQPIQNYEDGGRYCREYVTTAVIGGRLEEVYGRACRNPDGSWQIVS